MNEQKTKSHTGAIIAIIASSIVIASAIVALALLLPKSTSGENKDGDTSSLNKKDEPTEPIASDDDNAGIIAPSSENGNIGDHVRGKRDSKVLVVEYADPQCPGCASMMPKMDSIYEKYKDKVAFVYRHYPLAMHQNAESAAIAIEAAGQQGYFWEMLELVFSKRSSWISLSSNTSLTNAYSKLFKEASNNKGDVDKFEKSLGDSELKTKVSFDKKKGMEDELSYTPTILVNGEEVDFTSSSNPQKVIEDAIKKALNK
ncbi:MAG: DsbA family protein [Candidatus Saccharibacteria bacterium]|nr:DsbA family protein [Candidatus Saccharibacteria bacterium]